MVAVLPEVFVSGPLLPDVQSVPNRLEHAIGYVASSWVTDGMRIVTAAQTADASPPDPMGPLHGNQLYQLAQRVPGAVPTS